MMIGSKLRHGTRTMMRTTRTTRTRTTTTARNLVRRPFVVGVDRVGGMQAKMANTTTTTKTTTMNTTNNHHMSILRRSISTQDEQYYQDLGFLNEDGLTNFDTLHEMQRRACQIYATNDLFGTYNPTSKAFEFNTYEGYANQVDTCRAMLKDLGVQEYDKVAIISNNRWEWAAIAAATYSLNASLVPMYEAQLPSDWTYILNDSGSKVLFCATQDVYDRVQKEVLPSTPHIQATLCFDTTTANNDETNTSTNTDADSGHEPSYSFRNVMNQTKPDSVGSMIIEPTPDDLANLIYTSGTTGKPKGVELTHLNFTSNVKSASRSMVDDPKNFLKESDRSLSFLPWAHSYGQTSELWAFMSRGASMGICRGVPVILEDLGMVQPTSLFAVPTLYKKVYDGVHNMMESASPIRKRLMRSALEMGKAKDDANHGRRAPLGPIEGLRYAILDRLVLSKIRGRFGGNMRMGFAGGAACPGEVLSFMDSIGIPVCEGYGLTETSPIICINSPDQRQVGTVGKPIGGVAVYIVDEEGREVPPGEEGELCCVGPNVMKGYYNNKEATDEVITVAPDGKSRMFHTGDLARRDEDGWIRITGRLKEQYKLENGKYVVPTPIEEAIGLSRFISQIVLYGANRPHNVALIVPEWSAIRSELGVGGDDAISEEALANDERVTRLIDGEIASACAKLKKFEIPTKWAFVAPFTAANNMLTPKMSVRRHKVMKAYEDLIGHLYGDDPIEHEAADGAHKQEAA